MKAKYRLVRTDNEVKITNAKFMNHSFHNSNIDVDCFALRDMSYGEEILCDYSLFDKEDNIKLGFKDNSI